MSHKVIIESVATKKGNIWEGIALTPSVSLNHNIYSAEEIDSARNLNVPLKADIDHSDKVVGSVVFTSIPATHSLAYTATVTDESFNKELHDGTWKVSIEASVDDIAESCNRKGCYHLVSGLTMEGIGFTRNPGVMTTSLAVKESFQDWTPITDHLCENCKLKESEKEAELQNKVAALEKRISDLTTCKTCGKHKKL